MRRNKYKSLVIQNVVTREIEQLIDLDMVDEPESPDFSPDGRSVVFSALTRAVGDIYRIDLETHEVTNLTGDALADYAPVYAPDGNSILHLKRVGGNNKLFRLDVATGEQTQLTFGTHDEGGAQFIDERTIVFSSTAVDPSQPIDPDVARDGEIFNVWTLDVENGELRQYTDSATGNVNPIVLAAGGGRSGRPDRLHHLLQERVRPAHSGPRRRALHGLDHGLRRAGGPSSTSRPRSRTRSSARTRGRRAPSRTSTWRDGRR